MQTQPHHSIDINGAALVTVDAASHETSTRCAIHGIEMDRRQGNTYFCAECLGLPSKRHE